MGSEIKPIYCILHYTTVGRLTFTQDVLRFLVHTFSVGTGYCNNHTYGQIICHRQSVLEFHYFITHELRNVQNNVYIKCLKLRPPCLVHA